MKTEIKQIIPAVGFYAFFGCRGVGRKIAVERKPLVCFALIEEKNGSLVKGMCLLEPDFLTFCDDSPLFCGISSNMDEDFTEAAESLFKKVLKGIEGSGF